MLVSGLHFNNWTSTWAERCTIALSPRYRIVIPSFTRAILQYAADICAVHDFFVSAPFNIKTNYLLTQCLGRRSASDMLLPNYQLTFSVIHLLVWL